MASHLRPSRRAWLAAAAGAALAFALGMGAARMAAAPAPASFAPVRAPDFSLLDLEGRHHRLSRYADSRAVVLFVYGEGCTIARDSLPALRRLRDDFAVRESGWLRSLRRPDAPAAKWTAEGLLQRAAYRLDRAMTLLHQERKQREHVAFLVVDASPGVSREALQASAQALGIDFPVLRDETGLVARSLGVGRTAEALLVDTRTWNVVYRGPVDDRLRFDARRDEPRAEYLRNAIGSLLQGEPVRASPEPDLGCAVTREARREISYSREVAPLLERKCVACHQAGGVAPWAMDRYETVKGWSAMIREVTRDRRMPPWHADPAIGHFANDLSLSPEEIRLIADWADAGAPRGEGPDPLAARKVDAGAGGWPLGEPDLVVAVPQQRIPASGVLDYRYVTVELPLERDAWVRAVHLLPGNRSVVHHAFAFLKPPPGSGEPDYRGGLNGFFAAYVPGQAVAAFPDGSGQLVRRGTRVEFQLHYTPVGTETTDEPRLALYFHREPPARELRIASASNDDFRIPPHAAEHVVQAAHTFGEDVVLHALFPHMHLRGRSFGYEARYPDGSAERLLSVPNYVFGWQQRYVLAAPKPMPAGTRIVVRGAFDNSRWNPANPDPSRAVVFGEQTGDEMFIGYLIYTVPRGRETLAAGR